MMGEVASAMGDIGLRERLEAEISAFNVTAAGYVGGRVLTIAAHGDGGQCAAGCSDDVGRPRLH